MGGGIGPQKPVIIQKKVIHTKEKIMSSAELFAQMNSVRLILFFSIVERVI